MTYGTENMRWLDQLVEPDEEVEAPPQHLLLAAACRLADARGDSEAVDMAVADLYLANASYLGPEHRTSRAQRAVLDAACSYIRADTAIARGGSERKLDTALAGLLQAVSAMRLARGLTAEAA